VPEERPTGWWVCVGEGVGEPDPSRAGLDVVLVLFAKRLNLRLEAGDQAFRKWNSAVLFPFAIADDDLPAVEIDVFDADSAGFHESQAGAIHESGDEADGTLRHLEKDAPYFVSAEDDGQTRREFGAGGIEFDFLVEDFAKEEEECGEGLVLGTGGDLSLDGEVSEEVIDFAAGHFRGVLPAAEFLAMEAEELFDPEQVGGLGADGHMPLPHEIANFPQQGRIRVLWGSGQT